MRERLEVRSALLLAGREIRAALRVRWFLVYSAVFLVGGVALAAFGMGDAVVYGYRGFAKALAGLVHLSLLFVPLMALLPACAALAEEREGGSLEYLLAQPVTRGEVYAGKWTGVSAAVLLSMTVGLGTASALSAARGVPLALVALLYVLVLLLALAFVALGLLFSAVAGSRARAATLGLVVWLVFVALGTLGLVAAFIRWGMPESVLVAWSFVNPVEAFRLAVLAVMDPDLSLLGPVGARLVSHLGQRGAAGVAALSLLGWAVVPGLAGWALFARGSEE